MKSKTILFGIINELEAFERISEEITMENFTSYLNEKFNEKQILQGLKADDQLEVFNDNKERDVTVLITFMFKYAKYYLKKGLENSIINTPDEFAFLITLLRFNSLTKTELINKLITEKTSGVETIKRLIKKGLLEEFKDLQNKKNVRIKVTEKGKTELYSIMPVIDKITKIINGNLSNKEIETLFEILNKLDKFHNQIYFNKNLSSIEDILLHKEQNSY